MNWSGNILVFALRVYQRVVSPALAGLFGPTGSCRFKPSCSQYAVTAIQVHGPARGSALAVQRICRCHPWGGSGLDPVPASKFKVQSLKFKVGESAKELKVQSAVVPQAGLGRDQSLKFKVATAEGKSMRPYRRSPWAVPRIFHGS